MTTSYLPGEGTFGQWTTVDLARAAVEVLRDGNIVLNAGNTDYAAADLLSILATIHDETGIDLEQLWQVRAFAVEILDGRWTP